MNEKSFGRPPIGIKGWGGPRPYIPIIIDGVRAVIGGPGQCRGIPPYGGWGG